MNRSTLISSIALLGIACTSGPDPDTGLDPDDCVDTDTDTDTDSDTDTDTDTDPEGRAGWWDLGMTDYVLNEVALYYLGQSWMGATDVAEVLETLSRVDESDPYGWSHAFQDTAERLEAVARTSEEAGHPFSAAMAYQRASTYYRASLHRHPDPFADDVPILAQAAVDAHERYLALSGSPCRPVAIPYEDTTLPGYWCTPPGATSPAPTLIFHEGKDGWAEDGKFVVDAGIARGYNVLTFDGPGIGKTIRRQGLPFRPDWEAVITPVVDFLQDQPEVDDDRIGLVAVSLGGYLAPRAAAYEPRLAVLVANPGVNDWGAANLAELGYIDPRLPDLYATDKAAFDAAIYELMEVSDFIRWGVTDSMWHYGADSPSGFLDAVQEYKLGDDVKKIKARTLIMDADAETRGQALELFEDLETEKAYIKFSEEEAAQFHVQPGATAILTHRLFDWLDDNL